MDQYCTFVHTSIYIKNWNHDNIYSYLHYNIIFFWLYLVGIKRDAVVLFYIVQFYINDCNEHWSV